MSYSFVNVNAFTPNNPDGWSQIGSINRYNQSGNVFTLQLERDPQLCLQLSVLSSTTFRVRFNPSPGYSYSSEISPAVVNRNLGVVDIDTSQSTKDILLIDTGVIQIHVALNPYSVQVYRDNQLINQDDPSRNLMYIPGQEVVANFKTYPANAMYCGFGEKAGNTLLKNEFTMTFFNYDNYKYSRGTIPANTESGPLNPTEPLYLSVPLLIETNPNPQGANAGAPYTYGIFFDNTSQSYFNIGLSDYSDMYGKYYFGALYGDMDYYFMYGEKVGNVLEQYTTLTGRSTMPPKYVFGYHQGGYGYYNSYLLSIVANSYRAANIPIDGLHIDVDFQDNYRTFTSSAQKFPDIVNYMKYLHSNGFKCSTNITPLLTNNIYDENGVETPYVQRDAMHSINSLLSNATADGVTNEGHTDGLYVGQVSYGSNFGTNPYVYPPLNINDGGAIPLGGQGNYSDYSRQDVRDKWGEQYEHLINEVGMDMIWQDMTDPAIANSTSNSPDSPPDFTMSLDLLQNDGSNSNTTTAHAKVHNAYVINLLNATYSGLQKLKPEKRPFIIARGGYAGMQRYAALWTGDSASNWDFLSINIPEVLNIGLSGVPISGCDIGGFAVGDGTQAIVEYGKVVNNVTNYELLTRWVQLGAFLPWFRNHYDGYNKAFQEIYMYGEPVPTNCRKYIELRYRLLQLFYDSMYQWTLTGLPIARALFINDGQDQNVYNYLDDQFFVGSDFLVAPIITQHETLSIPTQPVRDVYLPAGSNWYSFMDNNYPLQPAVTGGTLVRNYYAGLDLVPVYIREGAIIPTRQLEQYVGQLSINPLTINIYPGRDNTYRLYLDDGISTSAALKEEYRYVEITHQQIGSSKQVTFTRLHDNYTPNEPFYFVALLGTMAPVNVYVDGISLPDVGDPDILQVSPVNSYYWNNSIQITFIKVYDTALSIVIKADFNV